MYTTVTVLDVSKDNCPAEYFHLCDDEGLLVEAIVETTFVKDHYGVPGSPVFMSPTDFEVLLEVNGVSDPSGVPDELYDLAVELVQNKPYNEWEE